jgi:uncharacterized protein (DUF2345 family)
MKKITLKKDEILVWKRCITEKTAYNNFEYPDTGIVEAEDWEETNNCGQGLHGWTKGFELYSDSDLKGNMVLLKVRKTDGYIELDDKVKFRKGEVVLNTPDIKEAHKVIRSVYPDVVLHWARLTAGDASTLMAGVCSTLTAGQRSTLKAGEESALTAGYNSTLSAGSESMLIAGDRSILAAGSESTLTAGDSSMLKAGDNSTLTAGSESTLTAGACSMLKAGSESTLTAGSESTLTAGTESILTAGEEGSTLTAGSESTLTAGSEAMLEAGDHSKLTAGDWSTLTAGSWSTLTAGSESMLKAWGNSTLTAGSKSTLTARDNSTLKAGNDSVFVLKECSNSTGIISFNRDSVAILFSDPGVPHVYKEFSDETVYFYDCKPVKRYTTTPEKIENLEKHEVFVFGSNRNGNHAGGAAKLAKEKFGAEEGVEEGLTGRAYAFPTLDIEMEKITRKDFRESIEKLIKCASKNTTKVFLVTKVGCGIAGFEEEEVRESFKHFKNTLPANIILPWRF